jgi:hypothetical protein
VGQQISEKSGYYSQKEKESLVDLFKIIDIIFDKS